MTNPNEHFLEFAENYLIDKFGDVKYAHKHAQKLADEIQSTVEDFLDHELPRIDDDEESAAEDAYWEGQIDAAREGDVD